MMPEEEIRFNKDKIKSVSDLSLNDLEEFINASVKLAVARMQYSCRSDEENFTDCTQKRSLYSYKPVYPSDGIILQDGEIIPHMPRIY